MALGQMGHFVGSSAGFSLGPSMSINALENAMSALAKILSRALTANQTMRVETAMMMIVFGLLAVLVSLANYSTLRSIIRLSVVARALQVVLKRQHHEA
jgi:hypothetical protein